MDRIEAPTGRGEAPGVPEDLFSICTTAGPESLKLDLEIPDPASGSEIPGPRVGRSWGRFEVRGFLGQGGMGQVFVAFDPTLRRCVALKVLRGDLATDAVEVVKEARTQARVDHPHVVKVFETGEIEGRSYLAMQLVPGRTLHEVARTLPLRARLRLFVQACYGVHAAHRQDLLHRDLKPGNILVGTSEDGRNHAYVTDFGLALDTGSREEAHPTGIQGTPHYMSPEQVLHQHLDPRSDVYALGVCLYGLLTGKSPYRGESTPEILQALLGAPPIPPQAFEPSLPDDLQALCLRCLAKEREDRYPSARALAEDLERWLAGLPVLAMPASRRYRARRWVARNPLLASLAVLLVVLALASAGLMTWNWARMRTQARHALRFNQEVADLEMDLAGIYQSPDQVTVSLAALKDRLGRLERDLGTSGKLAAGPGHAALGRAWLALEDAHRAESHYREALRLGFKTPEARLGLGVTLAAQFQESQRLMLGYDAAVQGALRRAAKRTLADAAVEQLRLARFQEVPVLVQARLLAGRGDYRTAVEDLDRAVAQQPWRQDLRRLQGETLLAAYVSRSDPSSAGTWGPSFEEVQKALAESRAWIRSDPFYWVKEGELRLAHAQRRGAGPNEVAEAADPIQEAVRRALECSADDLPALALSAQAHAALAQRLAARLQDPASELAAAEGRCRRILELRPEHPQAHALLLHVFGMRLLQWPYPPEGQDPAPLVKESMDHYQAALKARPAFAGILAFHAADLQQAYALWLLRIGKIGPSLEACAQGRALIQEALAHLPQWAPAYSTRASLKQWEGLCSSDPVPHLLESVKDLETCIRLDPGNGIYHYNGASRYCDLAVYGMESLGEDPQPHTAKALSMALEAQRLDPSDDTNGALALKAKTLQCVHDLRAGRARVPEARALVVAINRQRPVLRSSYAAKLWVECAVVQHLQGEDPGPALEEGRRALAQAQVSPTARQTLEAQLRMLQFRRQALRGSLRSSELEAAQRATRDLTIAEASLHGIRICLLTARQNPSQREACWAEAQSLVKKLEREMSPRSRQMRLLAAGLDVEMARSRGQAPPAWAVEALESLAQPGSAQRLEAERFLKGTWR